MQRPPLLLAERIALRTFDRSSVLKTQDEPWNERPLRKLLRKGPAKDLSFEEGVMGFGRGALLWLVGVPLPIIILLALFWHH
jgi:hypothetical protein